MGAQVVVVFAFLEPLLHSEHPHQQT